MPTDNQIIRLARPDEAQFLSDLALRSKAHWGYAQKYLDIWRDDLTITPDMCDGESLWVLEIDETVVGFGEIFPDGDWWTLDDLWIDPAYIGRGYGRTLLTFLIDLATRRGATRLRFDAEPSAVGFYERMGAVVVGERKSETVPGRVLPIMEFALNRAKNTTINPD